MSIPTEPHERSVAGPSAVAPSISVIGTGHLGAAHAAAMAELGFDFVGVDSDPAKFDRPAMGKVRFFEPGLAELISKHVETGRLRFTTDIDLLTEWQEFVTAKPAARARSTRVRRVIDARACPDGENWKSAGWEYHDLGDVS
jgi:UDP-N-acetyl-D-mannosaminuronate dehydrogenase